MDSSLDLKKALSAKDVCMRAAAQLKNGLCYSPFYESEFQDVDDIFSTLNEVNFWTISSNLSDQSGNTFNRNYVTGYYPRQLVDQLGIDITESGCYMRIHDHLGDSYVFIDGSRDHELDQTLDLITKYQLVYDRFGNPKLNPISHIWNYGSDMDCMETYFEDPKVYQELWEDYVEISIVDQTFNQDYKPFFNNLIVCLRKQLFVESLREKN